MVINCRGQAQVRPEGLTLACADGNDYLSGLTWTNWAPGTGHPHDAAVLVRVTLDTS